MEDTYLIIDFDSTFVTVEALDELATIALKNNPQKKTIAEKISKITKLGMEGKIPFSKSLDKRLSLFKANKRHIKKLVSIIQKKITPSINRNKIFIKNYAKQVYIISGGFTEYILPVAEDFGIPSSHVLANKFIFDKMGNVSGFDTTNPLSQTNGKAKAVAKLKLKGKIIVVGDGYTDYQIVKSGLTDKFFAFTENVKRLSVIKKANAVLENFDQFINIMEVKKQLSYPKEKIKVLLLENIHQTAYDIFVEEGYQVTTLPRSLSEKELKTAVENITILGIRSRTEITTNILSHAKHLLTIGAFAIGTNQVDLGTCANKGTVVFNAPYSNTRSVVELVMGEIIMLERKIFDKSRKMHQGIWDKSSTGSREVRGKSLGIIGYGNIGSQLSVMAEALGMNVYFYDIAERLSLGNAKKCKSLNELLKIADVVSVHVDGRKINKHLIAKNEFSQMKDGVLFLNLSRGFIVDMEALSLALKSGKVAGAAIDVFPEEPKNNSDPFKSSLQGLKNVILTPHIGGSTEEAQHNIGEFVANRIIRFINTGTTELSVNFPNLSLPNQLNAHRLIHIHKNTPGILANINKVLAENKINILGQYLKTNEEVGYVITDVDINYSKKAIEYLKNIPQTIRMRVLY